MQSWKAESRGTQALKTIIKEDESIYCLLIDELTQSIFVGTSEDTINQINLRSQKTIKKYQNLKINYIRNLSSFNNLLFVGGTNEHLTLIKINEKRVLPFESVEMSIG